jgi:hypothetical protein
MIYKERTHRKYSVSVRKTRWWLLHREITYVYFKNYMEHTHTQHGQSASFLVLIQVVCVVTNGLH